MLTLTILPLIELNSSPASASLTAAMRLSSLSLRNRSMTEDSALLTLTACTAPKTSPIKPVTRLVASRRALR